MKHRVFIASYLILIFGLLVAGYCESKNEEEKNEKIQQELERTKFKTETTEVIEPPGFLGIYVTSPQDGKGAKVDDIVPEGPADKAGIKKGDVILEINGEKVADEEFLVKTVRKIKPGENVILKIQSKGKIVSDTLQATVRPASSVEFSPEGWLNKIRRTFGFSKNYLGVKTCDIVPGLDEYFGVEKGALIIEVLEASLGERLGLKPGDVIIGIDEKVVPDCRTLQNIMRKKVPGSLVTIKAIRHQKTTTIKGILEVD
ncbi:MAG: PDZ domain-containing protein [candidate division WOR-3 bacterium]|nr:PDZ domain-containing protein [candidate division WOR-3 bacterium]